MKIFYRDNDIIVCEKEYGISSQKSDKANMLDLISDTTGTPVFPVHRLDITTTGIMVYALNQKSASSLCAQISERAFKKTYLAIAHGDVPDVGEMVDFLYHDKVLNKSFAVKSKRGGAKEARLEFKTLKSHNGLSLVHIVLHTGRTHQIRAQFSSRSLPLYGDGKYGAKDNDKIALYSHSIEFFHPKTGKRMYFSSLPNGGAWSAFTDELEALYKDS